MAQISFIVVIKSHLEIRAWHKDARRAGKIFLPFLEKWATLISIVLPVAAPIRRDRPHDRTLFRPLRYVMPTIQPTTFLVEPVQRLSMQRLMIGRLGLIFVLLLLSWWWTRSYLGMPNSVPRGLFVFFLFSLGLTAAYHLLLHLNSNSVAQIRAQFFIDTLLITWLVWETGDVLSPYISLYIILIGVVGFFLSKTDTLMIAGASVVCFTALFVLTGQSVIDSISGESRPSQMVQVVAFNNAAFLLVGLLAARLAERRRLGDELRETAENFADLHLLHERIVESIRSGLITTGLEGKIYTINPAAEEIIGVPAAVAIGKTASSLFDCDIFGRSLEASEFIAKSFEAGIRNSDATVAGSISPLIGRGGAVSGMILTFHDITELRSLEESLRTSDRLAAVGRMAAGLAHEIRNPLGSMSSALQFLQKKADPTTEEAALMQVVLRESDRLNSIITNFLAYARPQTDGFVAGESEPTDVGEAISDCITLLRHSPEMTDSHLLTYDTPATPVKIQVSETHVKQILWNVLQNSIKAMPGGGRLNVDLLERAGSGVTIVFQDSGNGISPENLENLFEPFAASATGTGLGLSIVHKIVTDHGGRIDVKSTNGTGTCVTVELPASHRRDAETQRENAGEPVGSVNAEARP